MIFFPAIANTANNYKGLLSADPDCKYDQLIEINLSEVIISPEYIDNYIAVW